MIGGFLLQRLANQCPGLRFKCLSRSSHPQVTHSNVEWFMGDLMSEADCAEFVDGLDVVIHLAQSNSPAISDRHWPSDLQGNMVSTLNLLEALRNRKKHFPCHMVFASSGGAVYGDGDSSRNESDLCSPTSPYGIQKLAIEQYIRIGCLQRWLTAVVLRIGNAYGSILPSERRQGFIGVALSRIFENKPVQLYGPRNVFRDFIHTQDIASAIEKSLMSQSDFEVYNIASGKVTRISEILDIFRQVTHKDFQVVESGFGARIFELMPSLALSIEKARVQLHWEPEVEIKEGISRMWNVLCNSKQIN